MSGTVEPDISPYGRAIAKNWGGIQVGIVKFNNIYYKK